MYMSEQGICRLLSIIAKIITRVFEITNNTITFTEMGKKSFEIILGSYEEFILGFKYIQKVEEAQQTFAVHSHAGSIRCVTNSGDYLASGGADDRIVVYNLKTRKEHCLLTHHNGTVNCLQFTNEHTHLISGGEDGMLAIIRVGNWQLEKLWENAHKGAAILDIALHPSGKLALTLGADATLRTWNLVKGRQAYVINLTSKSKECKCLHSIKWAPDGQRFVLVGNTYTDIWSIDSGGVIKSIEHKFKKVTSCNWYSDEKLIVGYEDGNFGVFDLHENECQEPRIVKGHDSRVKCITIIGKNIVTASSAGEIKVWSAKFKQLCIANAGCRLTCMCLVPTESKDKLEDVDESIVEGVHEEDSNDVEKISPTKNKRMKKRVQIEEEIDLDNEQLSMIKSTKITKTIKKDEDGSVSEKEEIVSKGKLKTPIKHVNVKLNQKKKKLKKTICQMD